ncbi:MAG TPA: sporulation protein YabP [Firmicutes bacterium]|jgi:sporulation protein YabP|nr:sporulation protein YabP [Bacillota bacterium]HAN95846.1 sporulation protein YabP [Bacillota bacterium]
MRAQPQPAWEVRQVDDRRLNNMRHQLILAERERLTLDGVIHVESFDDQEIVLETELGGLVVQGEDLHIQELNLEKGSLLVRGYIQSVEYLGDSLGKKSKGFLARLFR